MGYSCANGDNYFQLIASLSREMVIWHWASDLKWNTQGLSPIPSNVSHIIALGISCFYGSHARLLDGEFSSMTRDLGLDLTTIFQNWKNVSSHSNSFITAPQPWAYIRCVQKYLKAALHSRPRGDIYYYMTVMPMASHCFKSPRGQRQMIGIVGPAIN